MPKLITSPKQNDDLTIGFDRERSRRQQKLTKNKNLKVKFYVRIMLKDLFWFAGQQEKATYRLGYKFKITRKKECSVLNKTNAINNAKIKLNCIE